MKLIDLFNKIANNEKLPNKIKIRNDILICNKNLHLPYLQDYYYMENEENATWKIWYYDLNDEVEIIEDDKKIEHKKGYFDFTISTDDVKFSYLYKMETRIMDKINSMEK